MAYEAVAVCNINIKVFIFSDCARQEFRRRRRSTLAQALVCGAQREGLTLLQMNGNCALSALNAIETVRSSYAKVFIGSLSHFGCRVSCNIVRGQNGVTPPMPRLLPDATVQVTCVALLYIAHARAERDASKAAALKSRRGSISSSSATAFDIQATVQVAAVLQRLMLLLNSVVPAVVLRCCQVKSTLTFGRIIGFVWITLTLAFRAHRRLTCRQRDSTHAIMMLKSCSLKILKILPPALLSTDRIYPMRKLLPSFQSSRCRY